MYPTGPMWNHASPSLCVLSLSKSDSILVTWNVHLSRKLKQFIRNKCHSNYNIKKPTGEWGINQTKQSKMRYIIGLKWTTLDNYLLCPPEGRVRNSEGETACWHPCIFHIFSECPVKTWLLSIITATKALNNDNGPRVEDFKSISDVWP